MISASVSPVDGTPFDPIYVTTTFSINWRYRNRRPGAVLDISLMLHDHQGLLLFDTGSWDPPAPCPAGTFQSSCVIPGNLLNNGDYLVTLIFRDQGGVLLELRRVLQFEILDSADGRHGWFGKWKGILRPRLAWKTDAVAETDAPDPFLNLTM
jgi:lipopolysaccharide transport system ATP-binding protein